MSQRFDAPPPRNTKTQRNDAPPNNRSDKQRNDAPPDNRTATQRFDVPPNGNTDPAPNGKNSQTVLIVLIISIAAVVITGLALVGVIIINSDTSKPAPTTQPVAETTAEAMSQTVEPTTEEPATEEPATEEPTTEKPTEPPTEPPTESNVYHNVGYGWSVEIPDEWNEYGGRRRRTTPIPTARAI